jgi:hypothetical protein
VGYESGFAGCTAGKSNRQFCMEGEDISPALANASTQDLANLNDLESYFNFGSGSTFTGNATQTPTASSTATATATSAPNSPASAASYSTTGAGGSATSLLSGGSSNLLLWLAVGLSAVTLIIVFLRRS